MAVDTYALTSLTNLKTKLGISGSTDDTFLEDCIDRASDMIEQFLDYKVLARDYTEWMDGRGGKSFRLKNQPVNTVRTVAYGVRDAISVSATDATLIGATVAADGTKVRVTVTDSAGSDTVSDLSIATYPSIALMAAAIEALSGVSAAALVNGRSAQLHIQPGASFLDRTAVLTMAWDDGVGYRLDETDGTVWIVLLEPWSCGPMGGQKILVEYNAGEAAIPDDIEAACLDLASNLFMARSRDPGLQSENLGQYSYTTKIVGADTTIEQRLYQMIGARRRIR